MFGIKTSENLYLIIGVLRFIFDNHSQRPTKQQSTQTPVNVAIRKPRITKNSDQHRIDVVSEIETLSHLHVIIAELLKKVNVISYIIYIFLRKK